MIFWIALILLLWIISIVFNDIEDSLAHHYKDTVFDWLPKHTWFSWYMQGSGDVWKRKYNEDGTRKKFLGIILPAFVFDGWHGAKIIRQFFQYLTIYAGVHSGIEFPFILGLILFMISNLMTHSHLFYGGMFLKKWWK
jgi:hypothetical protein